ncbi:Hypothetical protein PHPALM_17047 [Phytophthora palmivora]|uniref:Uncharacterized protein n=1 Tax=Phytophthora palmivora TaxID=4796 RepID=A0A2P4XNA7_9STRA|nr:Hypothetical protein PHPALM_17047 [Phytophthora palmivora]
MDESEIQHADSMKQMFASLAAMINRRRSAKGITMTQFGSNNDGDVADYLVTATLYFGSKNIKYITDSQQQRSLSLLMANLIVNLKGPAAVWYDRQEHLRDQLLHLRQNNFTCLKDFVSAFLHIICKKGLAIEIRQEVTLHQFRNTTNAISFALMYNRTHAVVSGKCVASQAVMMLTFAW